MSARVAACCGCTPTASSSFPLRVGKNPTSLPCRLSTRSPAADPQPCRCACAAHTATRIEPPGLLWSCRVCSEEPLGHRLADLTQPCPLSDPDPSLIQESAIHNPGRGARGVHRPVAIRPELPAPFAGDLGGDPEVSQHLLPSGGQSGPARSSQRLWQTRTEQYHRKYQGVMDLPLGSTPQGCANPLKLQGMVGPNIYSGWSISH